MSVGRRRATSERGAAAVEFALVAPLLLMLVFGIIDYGYMLSYRQAISQGAAEGARAAAVTFSATSATPLANAVSAVNQSLNAYGVSCNASPAAPTSTSASGALVRSGTTVGSCSFTLSGTTTKQVSVVLQHDYRSHPLIPSVPGLGVVLPDTLRYTAVAQVN